VVQLELSPARLALPHPQERLCWSKEQQRLTEVERWKRMRKGCLDLFAAVAIEAIERVSDSDHVSQIRLSQLVDHHQTTVQLPLELMHLLLRLKLLLTLTLTISPRRQQRGRL
jgi:hypothetical protein